MPLSSGVCVCVCWGYKNREFGLTHSCDNFKLYPVRFHCTVIGLVGKKGVQYSLESLLSGVIHFKTTSGNNLCILIICNLCCRYNRSVPVRFPIT